MTSLLTTVLLVAGLTAVGVITAPSAAAATIPFTTFFSTQDNGAIALVGNSQMTCPTSASGCTAAQSAAATSSAQSGVNDNDYTMGFIDADSDSSTSNSTSADLTLPSDSTVLSALLVWGGRRAIAGPTVTVTTAQAQAVKFRTPGASGYTSLTGTLNDPNLTTSTDYYPYEGYIDVTAAVKAAGNGTYWVGDIAAATGADRYAGWSLIVAYRNPSAPLRDLRIYNGFSQVSGSNTATIPITGFLTPTSGTVSSAVGVVAWEGDRGFVGDGMQFGGQLAADGVTPSTTGTTLTDATRPANNFFDSAISDSGSPITARSPNYANTLGFDIGRLNATNILANGQTSTYVKLTTNGDTYYPTVVTTQIDLFTPAFNPNPKSVVDLSGNSPAKIGDTLKYQISLTNTGSDSADQSVITDALPANVTYVPGSMVLVANPGSTANTALTDASGDDLGEYLSASRTVQVQAGQGASSSSGGKIGVNQNVTVQFEVTVDRAAAGTTLANTPNLNYLAQTIGRTFNFIGNEVDTPVAAVADLALTKTGSPTSQTAGSNVTYTLTVKNNGPDAASNVVLTDTLPAGATYVSSSPPSGTSCSASGQLVTCTTSSLANAASIAVPITATIAPGTVSGTSLTDVAAVSSDTGDDVASNNTANATTQVTTSADVSLTKTVSPNPVAAGGSVTYTLTAKNAGPSTAANVVITDGLPLGLNYASSTPAGVCTNSSGTLTCAVGSLAPNATSAVTITAGVSSNVAAGTISNTATVTSTTPDPSSANNSATTPVTVTNSADLALTKTSSAASVNAGSPVTYTLTLTNKGPSDSTGVVITDPAVTGLTVVSAAASQGTCTVVSDAVTCAVGTVVNAGTVTVTVQGRLLSSATGTLTNTAAVTATTADPVSGNNSASASLAVTGSADVGVSMTAGPATIVPGQPVTYTVTVTNNGPSDAAGVVLTDTLPLVLTYSSASSGCSQTGGVVSCAVGALASGASKTYTITANASAAAVGTITNVAVVTATTPDPNTSNNTASAVSTTAPQADLTLTKSTSTGVVAGTTITYTLTVHNNGPSVASAVQLVDNAPTGITYTSVTGTGGLDCTGGDSTHLICTASSLANGADAVITAVGTVAPGLLGPSTNTATVSSATTDPTPGNNVASSTRTIRAQADVAVSLTAPSTPFTAGSTVTYSLQATNNGPSTARNVVITGQVPPGLVPVLGSSGGACVYTAGTGTVTCSIGDLPVGTSTPVIPLKAVIDPSQPAGTIAGTAVVGSDTPDPTSSNNTSTATITVVTAADLSIAKSVTPSPLVAGSPAVYTLTVTNPGLSDAQAVQVSDTLPAGLTPVSANPTLGACTISGQNVVCTAPTVQANSTMTVSVVTAVSASASASISNTATVSSSTTDPNPADDSATTTTAVAQTAHLTLSKTASPEPVVAGAAVTYSLAIVNNGPSDAANVVLDDPLPDGLTILSGGVTSTGDVCPPQTKATSFTCNLGTIPAGQTRTVQITAVTGAALAAGSTLTNTATLTSPTPDSDPSGRTATVTSHVVTSADLAIAKVSVTDPVEAGNLQTYVLQITNNGPSVTRGVVATDPLPAGVTLVSVTPSTGCTLAAVVTCNLGDLGPSAATTIQITVRLASNIGGTSLTNTATVASAPTSGSATPDPNPANNTSSATQFAATRSDLSLAKSITSGPLVAGSAVTYQLVATNNGPSDTTNMVITDPLPTGTTLVTATASNGGSCQLANPVSCSFPTVAAGASRTVNLTVALPPTTAVGATISNTATVTSANVNTTPDASTATATGVVTASADLSVVKTLLSGNPVAGGSATWQMVVHNAGPSQAADVVLDDAPPTGVVFMATTPSASCGLAAGLLHCALGAVSAGASVTVTVTGTLSADYSAASVTNAATVGSTTIDPDPTNNTSSTTADTTTSADLAVTNVATAPSFVAGTAAGWTVTVSNAGPSTAVGAVVTDVIPAGITGVTATVVGGAACTVAPGTGANTGATVITCPVGTVTTSTPVQIAVTGTLAPGVVSPTVVTTATVTATTPDPDPTDNAAASSTPVTTSADVSLTKTGPATLAAGQQITWTLTAHNAGPSDAQGVTVTDTLPAGLSGVSGTGPGGACSLTGSTLTCGVGTLADGADAVVTVVATTDPLAVGTLHNTAAVTTTTTDPNSDNNGASSDTTVTRVADVAVSKTFSGSAAVPGSAVHWTIVASNAGPSTATGVVVTDTLPAAVTGITATFGPTAAACTVTGQQVSCAIGNLPSGVPVNIAVDGTLASSYADDSLVNTATITSPDDTATPADDSSTSTTPVSPSADLSIGNALTSGPPIAGAPGRYVLTVGNAGPSDAVDVVVTDPLPADYVGSKATVSGAAGTCTITDNTVTCTFASVPVGVVPVVTVDGTFSQGLDATVVNTATVSAATPDPSTGDNSSTSIGSSGASADLQVSKTGPDTAVAGTAISWTVTVHNAGPSDAHDVTVTDSVPAGVLDATAAITGSGNCAPADCAVGTIPAGGTVVVTVSGTVSAAYLGTSLSNTAAAAGSTPDPDGGNNLDTATTTVAAAAHLSVVKAVTPHPLIPGTQATYTLTVANTGPSDAQSAVVTDPLPDGLAVRGAGPTSSQGDCTLAGRTVTCALGTLAADTAATVTIPVTVDGGFVGGSITNVATVSSPTPDTDTDPAGRTGTLTTPVTPQADLTLTKSGPVSIVSGQPMAWVLTLTNSGPSVARDVVIADAVPTSVTGLAATATQGACTITGHDLSCDIGILAAGDSARITLFVTGAVDPAFTGTAIDNTATVTSPTPEPGSDPTAGRTATAHTDVTQQADLLVSKVPSAAAFTAGSPASWVLTVTNQGPSTATGVDLTDTLPAGLLDPVFTSAGGATLTCPGGVCAVGTLAPQASVSITVSGTIDPTFTAAAITNGASVASDTPDPVIGNNTVTSRVPVTTLAHLVVVKTGPATVQTGQSLQWTIAVSNTGPSTARGVQVSDVLPAGISDVTVVGQTGVTCSADPAAGATLTCTLPDLPAGAPAVTIAVAATVDPAFTSGTLANTASATTTTTQSDPGAGDDTSTTTATVTTQADLSITKTGPTGAVTAGKSISWTVKVSNAGSSVARAVTVTDPTPTGVTGLTGTWSGGTCDTPCALGDLAPNASVTITYTGTVSASYTGDTVSNTATVASDTTDPRPANNSATATTEIAHSADVSITKTVSPNPVIPGKSLTYTLQVHNAGPSDATGVLVSDSLPAALTDVSATTTRGTCSVTAGVLSCPIPVLPSGGDATVTVSATLAADVDPGTVSNTATVSATTPDPDLTNNSSTSSAPTANANLAVTKTASVASVRPGGTLSWTITSTNNGSGPARNTVVTDQLPAGTTLGTATPSQGTCTATATGLVTCPLGTVAAGDAATVTITATVAATQTAALTNAAAASSPDESDPSDNTAQVTTPVVAVADLSLTKVVTSGDVVAGQTVSWQLAVHNAGPAAAPNVVVTDPLPTGISSVTASTGCVITGSTVRCALGTLAAGATAAVTLSGTVDPALRGTLTNTATVGSDVPDPNPADNTATSSSSVGTDNNVTVTKTADQSVILAGGTVTYRIQATQNGTSTSDPVTVKENIPAGSTVTDSNPSQGTFDSATTTWSVGQIAPGATATLLVTLQLGDTGDAVNTVVGEVEGVTKTVTAQATVKVTPKTTPTNPTNPTNPSNPTNPTSGGTLPNTGFAAWDFLAVGITLLLGGILLVVYGTTRRRRYTD